MKTKDLVYIGIIAYLAYLLVKKKPKNQETETSKTAPEGTTNNTLGTTVGNATNGGLNLGSNMDLPNLTPTPSDGLSTEVALNSSNIYPIIKDDNPTQIFGNVSLPTPYFGSSVINTNPIDVVPTASTSPSPTVTTTPTSNASTTTQPDTSTTISETIIDEPIKNVGIRPIKNISNIYSEEIIEQPIASTISTPVKGGSIIAEPISEINVRPIKNNLSGIYSEEIVEQPISSTISTPVKGGSTFGEEFTTPTISTPVKGGSTFGEEFTTPTISTPVKGGSIIAEPTLDINVRPIKNTLSGIYSEEIVEQPIASTISTPIKTIKAQLITNEPNLSNQIPISQDVSEEMILKCGNSFSVPNNDKEGSYTNFWFDGKEYYTQTTSPLIKTIPTKISKVAYYDGCKRLQSFQLQNSKS